MKDVYLSDNGIVSFNLPFTGQNQGTLNTRSTNPKLIYYINQLSLLLWEKEAPQIENLLLWHTKADVVKGLQKYNKAKLLSDTVSCVDTINSGNVEKFCGICSQCIDRRFAIEYADISEDEDPRGLSSEFREDAISTGGSPRPPSRFPLCPQTRP